MVPNSVSVACTRMRSVSRNGATTSKSVSRQDGGNYEISSYSTQKSRNPHLDLSCEYSSSSGQLLSGAPKVT